MTLDEAIKRYTSNAFYEKSNGNLQGCLEFEQLAEWLKELKQQPCEDCISRQVVLDLVVVNHTELNGVNVVMYSPLCKDIKQLPPVIPQKKTGHWIDTGSGQECSECGEIQHGYDNFRYFCAYCGATMIEPQESNDTEKLKPCINYEDGCEEWAYRPSHHIIPKQKSKRCKNLNKLKFKRLMN